MITAQRLGAAGWRAAVSLSRTHFLTALVVGLLLWVVGAPIVLLLISSVRSGDPITPGPFTLANYAAVYTSAITYTTLANTAVYAALTSAFALGFAVLFAWLIERTDMPGRNWAWTVMILPIAMPGMLSSMAWILLLSPKIGLVNVGLRGIFEPFGLSLENGPFNIYSLEGMIFFESIRGTATLFLMVVGAFRLMDPSLEEAAGLSGADRLQTLRRVTLGLLVPAMLSAWMYSFIGNLDDFETPLLIGMPAGVYILPTLIYFSTSVNPRTQWGLAAAYTSLFLLITLVLVLIYYRVVIRRTEVYASVTGKGFRSRRMSLGRWRYAATGVFGLYFVLTIALPLLVLIWASLLPIYQLPSAEVLSKISLNNYARMFSDPNLLRGLTNSLALAVITATGTLLLAALVSWLVVRVKVKGGGVLDAIAFIPHSIPTVTISVALIIFYLSPAIRWLPIYGTIWIMSLGLMTRFIAFATRTANASMTQVHRELEEAAFLSGADRVTTLRKIVVPLLMPAFIGMWVWIAAHAFRSLTMPLMLASPGTQTIATVLYNAWERDANFPLASAIGVLLLLGMGLLIFLSRKFIASGFTRD